MKIVVCLVALTALAHADPARWDAFPGPETAPAVTTGEAFVVVPASGTWDGSRASFVLAPIVEAKPHALIVEAELRRIEVPGAFVGPKQAAAKLKVGAYVLFPRDAVLAVGRITKATKGGYTIAYRMGDAVDHAEGVPANHVLPLDGKLHFAAPVYCQDRHGPVIAVYIGPAQKQPDQAAQLASGLVDSEVPRSWVLSNGELVQCRDVTPLRVAAFEKGAKVLVHGRSFVEIGGGEIVPVVSAIVTSVADGGLTYEVRVNSGDDAGLTRHLAAGDLFAR